MQCPNNCTAKPYVHGHYGKQKTPRFKCPRCGRTFSPKAKKPCAALKIPTETLYRVLDCLTEGCGIRSTARLNNVHPETVLKVLRIAGEKAEMVLDREMRNISAEHLQIDELWTFVYKKDKRVKPTDPREYGDQWVFAAVTEHKLIPCYTLGKREPPVALEFIQNVRSRIDGRFN